MYFTIKIARFLIRLCIKTLLLPFRIIGTIVGAGSGDTSDYEPVDGTEPGSADETASAQENVHTGGKTSATPMNSGDQQARQRITWFRQGLLAVGAVELLLGVAVVVGAGSMVGSGGAALIVGALLFFGIAPVAIGWSLPNHPGKAWYAGMAFVALQLVRSLVTIPVGLLWLIVYGAIGVCGYTGRPALFSVYGAAAGTAPSASASTQPSDGPSNDIDPTSSIEMADDTAEETDDTVRTDPEDLSSASDDEEVAAPPSAKADSGTEQPAAAETDQDQAVTTDETTAEESAGEPPEETHTDESSAVPTDPDPDDGADGKDTNVIATYRDELTADDPAVRASAVRGLADAVADEEVPDQTVIDALSERLDDDASSVRIAACEALGRLGADDVSSRLRDLRIDPDTDVSRAATRALQDLE